MGLNKKRIAQRQQEAKAAAKQEKNKKIGKIAGIVALAVVAVAVVALVFAMLLPSCNKKPDMPKLDKDVYYADIEVENYGKIVVELDRKAAPETVQNFVYLARKGFYNGLTFHRIMNDFMIQGGCPEGTGQGDAGYEIKGEFSSNGWNNPIKHERGVISMARGNDPDSASCQFFIVHKTSPHLDGQYAAFGKVTEGMEVVDKICKEVKNSGENGAVAKADQPVIKSITIREK